MKLPFVQRIWSEETTMSVLGINRKQLAHLRQVEGLPCIQLFENIRLYFVDEIEKFLEEMKQRR